ncbi:hypothetical protein A3F08_02830 [Candidatus Berkelbacteria bacterium RIFCSPHIGHO2_12_FULL_36_9]|uniref:Peptidase M50 domain-containing protein n=1 Tax=Candidatus Berkelbacteria bacterium RIFCSPHIGHO2_12_FULL_36_9 TaxID=1797469 RepID=A0A1F5EKT5_9BACT|nr:MAG: hypothetical protein A3F08_02830 [Candidatus Berkelbacteria bacterium RIFCSPHIGHO2_12_FULL_36_9]
MLLNLINNPQQFVAYLTALLAAITIHEYAHAWMANRLGDPTAKDLGRLSFNPLAHLDPLGTLFLLLAGFGWGKPVPVNSSNLKNEVIDNIKISLAGPFSNLIFAFLLGLIIKFIPLPTLTFNFFVIIIIINLVLMVFNLLPIPPLDGSHILELFLPKDIFYLLRQFGLMILFFLLIFSNTFPLLNTIISATISIFFEVIFKIPVQL